MADSDVKSMSVKSGDLVGSPGPSTTTNGLEMTAKNEASNSAAKSKAKGGSKETVKPAEGAKDAKLSGAEKKKKAKEEKAARRAKEKQAQQPLDTQTKKGDASGEGPGAKDAASVIQIMKSQHKRIGSNVGYQQHPLPLRQVNQLTQIHTQEPKKDKKKVGLFGHLYGTPRRTTIAGAGKDIHPAVLALGLQMSSYVICGSNARCVATLLVFKRVVESYVTPPQNSLPRHLTTHLSSQIDYLVSCRPLSISMGNAIRWLKVEISAVDPDTPESTAKADLCDAIDNFIREKITVAGQVIATSAAEKIQDGDVILTFGKSSTVQQTLVEAFRQGKKFRVIVIDSRPLFEGKNLARAVADLGLQVEYSLMHAISHAVRDATKVFLGAHAMMSNGRLYSRAGSAIVAMTAKEADIPVIVCCESVKFTDRVALDSIVMNEVAPPEELMIQGSGATQLSKWQETPNLQLLNLMYDLTPAEYINMVITEYGSLPPSSVPVVHRLSTDT